MKSFVIAVVISGPSLYAQVPGPAKPTVSQVWVADKGNGTYQNPVLHADYSDPDAIRVGEDYYLVASSFNHVPALPILHSRDLVNWKLIGYALNRQLPLDHFSKVQHGNGVWAPSIRFHKGEFRIYYPDPDFGIYLIRAKNILGPWTEPILVEAGKGLIDPCPFWDSDGKAYLVHAYAGSRAGIKSILVLKQLNAEGTKTTDDGVLIYDGHRQDPTIEGPKLYRRNGWYYILAPAGGVATGWQLALRSKNIYGPYERKVVLEQGSTTINGPHQGAWINTVTGEDWFLHFQDKGAYGRVVHLQPMKWINDWPVMGTDPDRDGKGEPILNFRKPNVGRNYPVSSPPDSDEFNENRLGLQWQWQANPKPAWAFPKRGKLRLFSNQVPDSASNFWNVPNLLMQKFPAEEFVATTKFSFHPALEGEKAGLVVFGVDYALLALVKKNDGIYISFNYCTEADKGSPMKEIQGLKMNGEDIYMQIRVNNGGECHFNFSRDGKVFEKIGEPFMAKPGRWVGAKLGIFCTRTIKTNDSGYADFDWFRIEKLQ